MAEEFDEMRADGSEVRGTHAPRFFLDKRISMESIMFSER
jgi:hypothetical protein